MDIEISIGKGVHSITSDNILCCNETGRVIAVFYNDYDLISLQEELETLRAENAKLIAERDQYTNGTPLSLAKERAPFETLPDDYETGDY